MTFDADRDGDIDFNDLVAAIKVVLDKNKDDQLTIEDFQHLNKDGDENIDYNDYRIAKFQKDLIKQIGKDVPEKKVLTLLIERLDDIGRAIF